MAEKDNLRPDYLDSLSDFADLLGTMDTAEKKAKELISEIEPDSVKAPNNGDKPENPEESAQDLDSLLKELDALIGLEKVKANVKSLINLIKVRKMRKDMELAAPDITLHLVFMGNPGTGKTTVARLLSKIYKAIGVLSKGQLIEVDRSGLVAGYVGQTAPKTAQVIDSAMGGILFIDEAYALAPGDNSNDFGREAIETLLKAMEDHRDDFVVIVAGYEDLMERFISSNPGLESRFNRYFVFEDYNGDQLFEIFLGMCRKNQYDLNDEAREFAAGLFTRLYDMRDSNFGNARDVRNIFENTISVHSDRIACLDNPSREDLTVFHKEDVEKASLM